MREIDNYNIEKLPHVRMSTDEFFGFLNELNEVSKIDKIEISIEKKKFLFDGLDDIRPRLAIIKEPMEINSEHLNLLVDWQGVSLRYYDKNKSVATWAKRRLRSERAFTWWIYSSWTVPVVAIIGIVFSIILSLLWPAFAAVWSSYIILLSFSIVVLFALSTINIFYFPLFGHQIITKKKDTFLKRHGEQIIVGLFAAPIGALILYLWQFLTE